MLFRRQICASLMTALLALSPVTHAFAGSHQHDVTLQAMHAETTSLDEHHDHGTHDHSSGADSDGITPTEMANSESDGEDMAKTCCHGSGGACAYLVSTAEDAASRRKSHDAVIESPTAVPHLTHLIPIAPPPRTLR